MAKETATIRPAGSEDEAAHRMRQPPRRALLLVNRHSRNGDGAIDAALRVLDQGGVAVEVRSFPDKHPIPQVIRAEAGGFDCVIVGGGDGSLNAAAGAVAEAGVPLGILPLGTANDLARSLGIVPDLEAAARVIVAGRIRPLDLGEVNGHLFWNTASLGLSTELSRVLSKKLKRRWGRLAYAVAMTRVLRRMKPFTAEIVHDGRVERVRTVQVTVGNGRQFGANLTVDENAQPDDGLLRVYSLEVRSRLHLLAIYPSLRKGRLGARRDVRSFACTGLEIRTPHPMQVNTDGSLTTETPAVITIHRRAARVYVPDAPARE
jgi:diacylglycerol kinase (ATP)